MRITVDDFPPGHDWIVANATIPAGRHAIYSTFFTPSVSAREEPSAQCVLIGIQGESAGYHFDGRRTTILSTSHTPDWSVNERVSDVAGIDMEWFLPESAVEQTITVFFGVARVDEWADGDGRFDVDFPRGTHSLEVVASGRSRCESGWHEMSGGHFVKTAALAFSSRQTLNLEADENAFGYVLAYSDLGHSYIVESDGRVQLRSARPGHVEPVWDWLVGPAPASWRIQIDYFRGFREYQFGYAMADLPPWYTHRQLPSPP